MISKPTNHALKLGILIQNFQTLEFALRAVLHKNSNETPIPNFDQMKTGDIVDCNEMTDYSSLSKLIEKYNAEIAVDDNQKIDPKVVKTRDALAHGRVSAASPKENLHIIKFERPTEDNKVRVSFSEEMNNTWLDKQRDDIAFEIRKVLAKLDQTN